MVSITNVLKSECVNTCIAIRRKQLNGENIQQARVELNRNIILSRLITMNTYKIFQKMSRNFEMRDYIRTYSVR